MEIFTETLDGLYTGATADDYAQNMADMFNYKINYFRDTDQKEIF
jgi:hemoglobin